MINRSSTRGRLLLALGFSAFPFGCSDRAEVPASTSADETRAYVQNPFGPQQGAAPSGEEKLEADQPPK